MNVFECFWRFCIDKPSKSVIIDLENNKGNKKMLTSDRQNEILKSVNENGSVSVADLMEQLGASESTIRRDLLFLDKAGKLKKVHGGAKQLSDSFLSVEYNMDTKSTLNVDQKEAVGKYAATLIHDDDFVFIDAGSSTMHMVEHIGRSKAVFVTNGIAHAKKLIKKGLRVIVIGGELKLSTEAIIGIEAVSNVEKYNFTKSFMGTNGISVTRGFTTPDISEALLKKRVCELAYVNFVLADNTKFGVTSSVTFADIRSACIITDTQPAEDFSKATVIKVVPEE